MNNNIKRKLNMVGLSIKKHSPEILAATGAIGVGVGTVLACKATLKLNDILEESKETVDKIHMVGDNPEKYCKEGTTYDEDDVRKDLALVYFQTGLKVAKLYLPAAGVMGLSLAALLGSNHILRKRNAALGAALATTTQLFKDYRGRVVERFGERVDFELRNNVKTEEIETVKTDEDGNEETVTETVDVKRGADVYSEYAKCFDESNPYYQKDAEYNLTFLRQREAEANMLLCSKGYLFLNDVYKMLGFPETKAGQVVGWIYDNENPVGDNFVDFGIYDVDKPINGDFVNGYEKSIWLDFNVDGNVYDKAW